MGFKWTMTPVRVAPPKARKRPTPPPKPEPESSTIDVTLKIDSPPPLPRRDPVFDDDDESPFRDEVMTAEIYERKKDGRIVSRLMLNHTPAPPPRDAKKLWDATMSATIWLNDASTVLTEVRYEDAE